jgi:hypothetical protein
MQQGVEMLLHHLGKKEIIAKTTRGKKNTKKKEIVDDATPCRYLVFSTNFFNIPNSLLKTCDLL